MGHGPEIYVDPGEFLRKTHLTTRLSPASRRVAAVLNGGGETGDRIIGLQTAIGGSETHTPLTGLVTARLGKRQTLCTEGE